MNILFINNLYGRESAGGAEEIVRIRARRFASEGHRVYILATCRAGDERKETDGGITVQYISPKGRIWFKNTARLPGVKKLVWHIQHFFDRHTSRRIIALCREWSMDRVETHNLMGISMQLPRMLHRAQLEHHHYLHDIQLVEPSGILPATHTNDSSVQRLYSVFTRWAFRYVSVMYSPTIFLKKFYITRGFFPNSEWRVEHEELFESKKQEVGKRKREEGEVKRYLFVGYLGEHKGVPELLEAWEKRETEDAYHESLTIVGDGVLRSLVERAVEENSSITYLGRIPHEDLGSIYADHDVLLFPSQCIENRPNVIAEAMTYQLEIVAVKTGGVEEMVEGYKKIRLLDANTTFSI